MFAERNAPAFPPHFDHWCCRDRTVDLADRDFCNSAHLSNACPSFADCHARSAIT